MMKGRSTGQKKAKKRAQEHQKTSQEISKTMTKNSNNASGIRGKNGHHCRWKTRDTSIARAK